MTVYAYNIETGSMTITGLDLDDIEAITREVTSVINEANARDNVAMKKNTVVHAYHPDNVRPVLILETYMVHDERLSKLIYYPEMALDHDNDPYHDVEREIDAWITTIHKYGGHFDEGGWIIYNNDLDNVVKYETILLDEVGGPGEVVVTKDYGYVEFADQPVVVE